MHISAINSCDFSNKKTTHQQFKGLIKDKSVMNIIKNMSKRDSYEFRKIEKRLSKTKFWDMKISSIGDKLNGIKFEFIDKKKKHGVITDGIFPYRKEGNAINVYSIVYGSENISQNTVQTLKYKSDSRAAAVYNKYLKNIEEVRRKGFNLTPIESIKSKEIELDMLEEAASFADGNKNAKILDTKTTTKLNVGNDFKF